MTTEVVAESSVINCDCLGALEGRPETMCESCLDAYGDAVIQQLQGADLQREIERLAAILSERLKGDPDLADSVTTILAGEFELARHQKQVKET